MSYFKTTKLIDGYGFGPEFTPMDEMRCVEPVRLVGTSFSEATIDANFWTATPTNSGTITADYSQVILNSNTSSGGAASLQSVRKARYIGGASNRFRGIIQLGDLGTTNNVRRWGMFDGVGGNGNGAYFKLDGTTLSVCTTNNNTEAPIASTSWNKSTTIPVVTNANSYEIYITNRRVYFTINGTLVHTAEFSTSPWTRTLTLPIRVDTTSTGVTTNCTITVRTATIYRFGAVETASIWKYVSSAAAAVPLKNGAGSIHSVINMDNAAATITLYDSLPADVGVTKIIAVLDLQNVLGTIDFHLDFYTALSYTTTGSPKITIVYE